MKANELMIGDWVLCGEKPVRVLQLSEGKDYKYINPIPITPEILEKNGFVRVERGEICTCYRWREKSDKIYGRLVDIHLYKEPIQGVFTLIEIETCSNKGDGLNRLPFYREIHTSFLCMRR